MSVSHWARQILHSILHSGSSLWDYFIWFLLAQYIQNWCINHFGRLQVNWAWLLPWQGLKSQPPELPFLVKNHTFVRGYFTSGNMDVSLLWWFGIMFSAIRNKVFRIEFLHCHTSKLFYQYGQDFSLYLTIFLLF